MTHYVGIKLKSSKICLRNGELDNKEYVLYVYALKLREKSVLS
jgi:hypothetical protein